MCLRFKDVWRGYGILSDSQRHPFCFQFNCAAIKTVFGELHLLVNRHKENVIEMDTGRKI